jgi:hypothetical protein
MHVSRRNSIHSRRLGDGARETVVPDTNYGPAFIVTVAVLLGALLSGIGAYGRGSAARASSTPGLLYGILIVSPVVARIVSYIRGLNRDLTRPSFHLNSSAGSPPTVQRGARTGAMNSEASPATDTRTSLQTD